MIDETELNRIKLIKLIMDKLKFESNELFTDKQRFGYYNPHGLAYFPYGELLCYIYNTDFEYLQKAIAEPQHLLDLYPNGDKAIEQEDDAYMKLRRLVSFYDFKFIFNPYAAYKENEGKQLPKKVPKHATGLAYQDLLLAILFRYLSVYFETASLSSLTSDFFKNGYKYSDDYLRSNVLTDVDRDLDLKQLHISLISLLRFEQKILREYIDLTLDYKHSQADQLAIDMNFDKDIDYGFKIVSNTMRHAYIFKRLQSVCVVDALYVREMSISIAKCPYCKKLFFSPRSNKTLCSAECERNNRKAWYAVTFNEEVYRLHKRVSDRIRRQKDRRTLLDGKSLDENKKFYEQFKETCRNYWYNMKHAKSHEEAKQLEREFICYLNSDQFAKKK